MAEVRQQQAKKTLDPRQEAIMKRTLDKMNEDMQKKPEAVVQKAVEQATTEAEKAGLNQQTQKKIEEGDISAGKANVESADKIITQNPETSKLRKWIITKRELMSKMLAPLREFFKNNKPYILVVTTALVVCIAAFIYFKRKQARANVSTEAILESIDTIYSGECVLTEEQADWSQKKKLMLSSVLMVIMSACFAAKYVKDDKMPSPGVLSLIISGVIFTGVVAYKSPTASINILLASIFRQALKSVVA